jgi:RNA polymerase sigma-70 factor (ECF subfamily)
VTDVEPAVARAFRDEWGQVVATLIRITGDWDLAEDGAADAFATAVEHWRRDGIPASPGCLAHHDRARPRDRSASTRGEGSHEAPKSGGSHP